MIDHPQILQLDISGNPQDWITYEVAAYYYAKDLVAWTPTQDKFTVYGGTSRVTCSRSFMDMSTIIAVKGEMASKHLYRPPSLTNKGLFRRDQHLCAYCGEMFSHDKLTRDHIHPTSRGGKDVWMNVVAACSGCNRVKDDRTPDEAGMELIFSPYTPVKSEMLLLANRNVLTDQMAFLKERIPETSRVHNPTPIRRRLR
jgi:5-methylcytosine-specific restriction endonuclease McrA